ncbi:uncharacterized protein BYT42DRAFT_615013 [Radiomyces spectabilis]|uniref:uncharacterized protein n=1 Tax=Radiomyces spectabilis TaxID=64574 RepID=UPI0022207048|nr:uncharacterized protein BYT42DRAFT_615013 [Radiomyces spectabilis]KAI8376244.1 hypothetical protein BYT42DRAFT_615013 [Radiomyces spectabilis]
MNSFSGEPGHFWLERGLVTSSEILQKQVFPQADSWLEKSSVKMAALERSAVKDFCGAQNIWHLKLISTQACVTGRTPEEMRLREVIPDVSNRLDALLAKVAQAEETNKKVQEDVRKILPALGQIMQGHSSLLLVLCHWRWHPVCLQSSRRQMGL